MKQWQLWRKNFLDGVKNDPKSLKRDIGKTKADLLYWVKDLCDTVTCLCELSAEEEKENE